MFSHYPAIKPKLSGLRLQVLPAHPCNYFSDRSAQTRAFHAESLNPEIYQALMDAGFRRSGRVVYQPICAGCRACVPIRVRVDQFRPNKSQRRCWAKNQDLVVTTDSPVADDEAYALYRRYLREWHGSNGPDDGDRESFESFLYSSPVNTIETRYRNRDGRLIAVGLCDLSETSLSSVYFYFKPSERSRGLGTFGALWEIEAARGLALPFYYLGYWIAACTGMSYKANFASHELLSGDGEWRSQKRS